LTKVHTVDRHVFLVHLLGALAKLRKAAIGYYLRHACSSF